MHIEASSRKSIPKSWRIVGYEIRTEISRGEVGTSKEEDTLRKR